MATLTTIASFNGPNGAAPLAGVIADANGDLFGTTVAGGPNANGVYAGTVFEIPKTTTGYGPITVLAGFNGPNGAYPGGLIADANGDLFGTTWFGYLTYGTVFEIPKTASSYGPLITLASFSEDGRYPNGLIADANGDLFGTTEIGEGGSTYGGTVFEIPKTASGYGAVTTLAGFSITGANGLNPSHGLIADANGDLFGTTYGGGPSGAGTVFEIQKTASGYGPLTTLASFSGANGANPAAGVIADSAGDLFGTTRFGGAYGGTHSGGTVFEIPKTASGYGPITTLASFSGGDLMSGLMSGLIADATGDLFGTTYGGGPSGAGTVFEIQRTASGYGPVTTLASFSGANGANPFAGLLAGANGDLFGTTDAGGSSGYGTVFEITGAGFVTVQAPMTVRASESVSGPTNETSDTITVTAKARKVSGDAIAGVEIYDGANDLGAATLADGAWSFTATGLADGAHAFKATVTDLAGNSKTVGLRPVKVDTTPPTSRISESVTLGGGGVSVTVIGIAKDKVAGVESVSVNGEAASLGAGGAWSYADADLATGAHAYQALVTDKAGNQASVAASTVTLNGANSIALSGGNRDGVVIASAAGGNSIDVTGETSDRFVYEQTLGQYDTITGFVGAGPGHDVIDLFGIAGATTYQGALTKCVLNADSVGWLYDALHNETAVYVNNTGAAESLTGANAAAPMLELAGHVALVGANFTLAKA